MIDKSHDPEKNKTNTKLALLGTFAPVPRLCNRHDGWTAERQRGFIAALADNGSVRAAAHAVNMTPEGAYLLRRHPEAAEFRKAWDMALKCGVQRLEDIAMDRALNGVEAPVYSYGKIIGTRIVHNDALLMFLLRNRAKRRFAADSWQKADAATRGQLEKLKQQWRAEWERERAITSASRSHEQGDSFAEMIETRHVRWWAGLSPRAREAYIAFRRIESEDRDYDWEAAEDADTVVAEYHETFVGDGRARINKLVEADGLADERVLGEYLPAEPPHGRMITLRDGGWNIVSHANDGRATPV